ncbi:MAG: DUF4352 domain-containing protein [Ancrocorticia sp.]|nr:DUF4352 domain-containing protein [Ancrocorticia sp.]MCI2193784.1 DUF4352 domain-containing protein [Ancrocorticia sp.]
MSDFQPAWRIPENHAPSNPESDNTFNPETGNAFSQVPPHSPFSQPYTADSKNRGSAAWIVMIVIGVVAIIAGVLMASGTFSRSNSSQSVAVPTQIEATAEPSAQPSVSATPQASTSPVAVPAGMTTVGNWAIKVTGFNADATKEVESTYSYSKGYVSPLSDGEKYIGVRVTVTNISAEELNTYTDYAPGAKFYYSDGADAYTLDEFFTANDAGTVAGIGSLAPGESGESWLYFKVPSTVTSGKVSYMNYETWKDVDAEPVSVPLS